MSVWIQQIVTEVPDNAYPQSYASQKMQDWITDERQKRLIRALYRKSGIDKRHSVIANFDDGSAEAFFQRQPDGTLKEPATGYRNDIFCEASQPLVVEAARRVLARCPDFGPNDITHVITVSCTGFSNPGPDYHVVTGLGLSPATQRYHLGFMGCYAALPALRMAKQFCQAEPQAAVLVISLELCSLHLQLEGGEDSMLANSLFADGVAAALVSSRPPRDGQCALVLGEFCSSLIPSGKEDMAWRIGDRGFDISLSSYVPKIIGANINAILDRAFQSVQLQQSDIDIWAVHPGGKAIVDKVQQSLELEPEQVSASRQVLKDYGNMSSATILFVLKQILQQSGKKDPERICAMAFGPGLTVELLLLRKRPGSC